MDEKYSWVDTHKELTKYLSTKENSQQELIDLLKSADISPFNDKSKEGDYDVELNEIDPFTFFCYIHKYGDKRRLNYLQQIAEKLNIKKPLGVEGIPTSQPQKVWMFPSQYLRTNNEVARLWSLFKKELKGEISDEDFADVLKIKNVGDAKLTEVLFYINPEKYLPINGPTKPYIKEVLGLDTKFTSYSEYIDLLSKIREKIDIPFYELSHTAWKWNKERNNDNNIVMPESSDDPVQLMIENYKKHIAQTQLKDEVYKWELIEKYKGRPNLDADDLLQEIKSVDYSNLMYAMGKSVLNRLASERTEGLRELLENLFDESRDLTERVKAFNKQSLKLYRELESKLGHHQDERSISAYLTLRNPEKYTFYKHTFYKNYCKLIGIKQAKENEKYTHYLTLIDELIENYILPDKELIELVKSYIPQYHDGTNHKLLAQDIFYQMLDRQARTSYWVFQGNPKQYNFEDAIKQDALKTWTVTAHKDKIKEGDKVIIWLSGKDVGCYALAEVKSKTYERSANLDDEFWLEENKNSTVADIEITHNLVDNPLMKDVISSEKELTNLNVGIQGSNFTATETEYNAILKIINQPNSFEDMKINHPLNTILYGPPGTGKTYNTVLRAAEIIEDRKIEDYDEAIKIFNDNRHKQLEFITFHQNYSYEDFIQGIRPDTDDNEVLTFEKRDGIFKKIADRALKNLIESETPTIPKMSFEDAFNQFILPLTEGEVEEIEVKMTRVSYYITAVTDKSIDFRKASGGTAHTLSISTLNRMYDAESVLEIRGLTSYYAPLLKELLKIGKDSSSRKEVVEKKNYVIIIDEINRANISRVFGELITLIEVDKRSHGQIPLETKLPSGDKFMVPSNLYIIGTMNTADKSIALLDIALRRRFEFEAMYPLYNIKDKTINDADILKKLNDRIIETKGHDFQIGHSFFMGSNGDTYDLNKTMNNKVIPLLLEYYMNDEKEVKGILLTAGLTIEENAWPLRITGKNDKSI